MAGYLDKVRELKKSWHASGIGPGRYHRSPESGGQSPSSDVPKGFQLSLDCEISELSEISPLVKWPSIFQRASRWSPGARCEPSP